MCRRLLRARLSVAFANRIDGFIFERRRQRKFPGSDHHCNIFSSNAKKNKSRKLVQKHQQPKKGKLLFVCCTRKEL